MEAQAQGKNPKLLPPSTRLWRHKHRGKTLHFYQELDYGGTSTGDRTHHFYQVLDYGGTSIRERTHHFYQVIDYGGTRTGNENITFTRY